MAAGNDVALVSTWAAQSDLPPLDPTLVENIDEVYETGSIGNYNVLRMLGEGEFACVYECGRPGLDGTFALKAIIKAKVQRHNNLHKSKRNIRRVNTEVMAMRKFSHGGICELYDVMQSSTMVYLVMEMGERDLFAFLDEHPDGCPELIMKQIARILALGLRHCHNHGVAHRDIKPENILVCGQPSDWANADAGIVKLCDFGLCAPIHPGELLNDFVGSPGFFAPELMMRRRYDGAKADMWSLGAVMVEMFLGHKFFDSLWCPPYEYLSDVEAFSTGIASAVARVKLGSHEPPSEPVRKLFDQLLQVEPERRASIDQICSAKWFELLRVSPEGYTQLLRLTFDRESRAFERPSSANRRVAYRELPPQLSTIHSIDSAPNLVNHQGLRKHVAPSSSTSYSSAEYSDAGEANSVTTTNNSDAHPQPMTVDDPILSKIHTAMAAAPEELDAIPDFHLAS